jgi:hypothetical protein
MKKSILNIFAAVLTAIILTSCGGGSNDASKSPQDRLEGKWKIVQATGDFASLNEGTIYIFEGKKRFTTKKGIIESKGDLIQLDDATFTVKFDGMESEFNYTYKFDDNKLIVEAGSQGQVFTLEKQ